MTATLNKCRRFGTTVFAVLLLIGCTDEPTIPLATLNYQYNDSGRQRNLLVLLRGFGADNHIFAEERIIDEIRSRKLPFDVIAPDVHFGYYQAQTVEVRLKQDVIEPACRQGYKHIWLAGFSMGGLGCLSYQERTLCTWIRNHDTANTPPIWLGYGDSDILTGDGPPLLATTLPPERVFTVPGNHDIKTFNAIFLRHLDTLARESAATVSHKN